MNTKKQQQVSKRKEAPKSLRDLFLKMIEQLNEQLMERSEAIWGCVVAILARKHVFFIADPGTAKSALIKSLASAFVRSIEFSIQLDKQTRYEKVFGPLNLDKIRREYEYLLEGYAADAHFCLIDEIWKANASILDSFLWFTDESREFKNGRQRVKTPLISCFTASNELPEGDGLKAHYDRLHLRYKVDDIVEDGNFIKAMRSNVQGCPGLMTIDDLYAAHKEVDAVEIDQADPDLAVLRGKLKAKGLRFSVRRWKESRKILQAHAWLKGHSAVELDDFEILQNVFWDKPGDIQEVSKIVMSMSGPDVVAALAILDKATKTYAEAMKQKTTEAGIEANTKLKACLVEIREVKKVATSPRKVAEIEEKLSNMNRNVLRECLGQEIRS